jgi:hypothetical protein
MLNRRYGQLKNSRPENAVQSLKTAGRKAWDSMCNFNQPSGVQPTPHGVGLPSLFLFRRAVMSDFFKPASEAPEGKGTMIYTFYEDPGHGWLEVPVSELVDLAISGEITPYSYLKAGMAYLEEDCDLSTFVRAKAARNQVVFYRGVHQDNTPIRHFDSYQECKVAA